MYIRGHSYYRDCYPYVEKGEKTMKNMIVEKVLRAAGDKLAEIAVSPRDCWFSFIYEPRLSPEMINELIEKDV